MICSSNLSAVPKIAGCAVSAYEFQAGDVDLYLCTFRSRQGRRIFPLPQLVHVLLLHDAQADPY
jgi:hypothetical protein